MFWFPPEPIFNARSACPPLFSPNPLSPCGEKASDEDEEAYPRPPIRVAIQDGGVFHPTAAHPTVRRDDDYDDDDDDDERRLAVAD